MMRMLWVTMGMCMTFVAPSLTMRRCPCVTSFSYNIVRIAVTRLHVTLRQCFLLHGVFCEGKVACNCLELG